MEAFILTPVILAGIAGAILSLAFSFIPGLNTAFAAMAKETKQLIMMLLLLGSSVLIFALGCWGIIQAGITCDRQGAIEMVWIFISAVMANQSVYQITPQPAAVRAVKAELKLPTQNNP